MIETVREKSEENFNRRGPRAVVLIRTHFKHSTLVRHF